MRVAYCDGRRFRRAFAVAAEHVIRHRAELNRINVFPVPDGDTGTNLAVTLRGMMETARRGGERALGAAARRLAEAGVVAARGNSGMLFARFFSAFAESVQPLERADAGEIAAALRHSARRLYEAVERPVEGTLLTVVREVAQHAQTVAGHTRDLDELLRGLLDRGREALAATTDALPALREAGVVDAGAKGFVRFLEGAVRAIAGAAPVEGEGSHVEALPDDVREVAAGVAYEGGGGRYCTEFLIRADELAGEPALAAAVRALGSSLVLHRTPEIAKIHIHTDDPAGVRRALRPFGRVETAKVEDMVAQHRRLRHRPIAIVTDSTCDLPPEWVLDHDVTVIPMTILFGEETYLDQVEMGYEEFLRRLTAPGGPPPTTSQPSPAQFREAFARALESADEALVLLVSGQLSGTLSSAQAVAREFEGKVRCLDSRSASLGLGFLVMRAVAAIAAGASPAAVIADLERVRARATALFTLDTLEYVLRSGRVGAAKAFLANLFDLKPILSIDEAGRVVPAGRARGRDGVLERIVERIAGQVPSGAHAVKFGIVHAAYPEIETLLAPRLRERYPEARIWARPITGVLAAHAGPGAWGVFTQVEEVPPPGAGGAEAGGTNRGFEASK